MGMREMFHRYGGPWDRSVTMKLKMLRPIGAAVWQSNRKCCGPLGRFVLLKYGLVEIRAKRLLIVRVLEQKQKVYQT